MSGCAEYCLRVVGLLWAVLGVPGAPSGRVWPVGSGGVASRGCIHTSKTVSQKASAISLWHSPRYKTLILTIARKMYLSVPSRGSCDPAEWTASHSRWRGVLPSTPLGRS